MQVLSDLWTAVQLSDALTAMTAAVSTQVTSLIPVGIGLMCVLATPRIVKRILHTFIG